MNATNRVVNRAVLFLIGAILIAVGGIAAAAALWPDASESWSGGATAALEWMQNADEASRLSETSILSWLSLAALALLLLIVVIAVIVIARLGGGRSVIVVRAEAEEARQGAVTILHGFASDAITHSLTAHDEILSSRVEARRVRGTDVLHVSVTPRQNTSPVDVADTVTGLVDNLAALTGRETPTLVSIRSGVRSRLAADQARVS